MGGPNAAMTLIEYSDFQCPYCAQFSEHRQSSWPRSIPNDVQVVFRHFPLPSHPLGLASAPMPVEAAGRQGKFWELEQALILPSRAPGRG
jgi:protein-disulfide isomerase